MEIITRTQARERKLSQYFTGVPCVNGHLTYRYTQSGTCAGCIRSYNCPIEVTQIHKERRERLATMIQFRARVSAGDLSFYSSMVLAAAMDREPRVTMRDVWKGGEGSLRAEDSAVHVFSCFAEDLDQLREAAKSLFAARCVSPASVAEIREQAYATVARNAEAALQAEEAER